MATRTLTGLRTGRKFGRAGLAIIASSLAVIAGLTVAIVVAATFALNPAPERVVEAPAPGPMDDYYFRHQPAPIQLGPQDDYGLRHGGD